MKLICSDFVRFLVIILFMLIFDSLTSFAFYGGDTGKGWWWYAEYYKENETTKVIPQRPSSVEYPKQVEQAQAEKKDTSNETDPKKLLLKRPLSSFTFEELMTMPLDQFTALYNYYLEKAIENPTEENVFNYMNLQDVLVKRAIAFTSSYAYVMQKYSDYFGGGFYPTVYPGVVAVQRSMEAEIKNYVEREMPNFGILYFSKRGCPYCDVQSQINRHLISRGIMIKVVDIDVYPWLAQEYGVTIVPSIYVVLRDGRVFPVGSGVLSVDEIYRRLYNIIKIAKGDQPEGFVLPDFQRGTPLDPRVPPPLWQQKKPKNN